MRKIRIYQIDAFSDKVFSGNPAAVCPLDEWLDDELLQAIAMENNLAETAFFVKRGDDYQIRWFTPTIEVDLCGHATLAAACVLFNYEGHQGDTIDFYSHRSGSLGVARDGDFLTLDFPVDDIRSVSLSADFKLAIGSMPIAVYKGRTDYMFIYETEEQVQHAKANLDYIRSLDARGLIITAKGSKVDFVSRFFGPQSGVDEDPVTGSAHTTLTPYWSQRLGKNELMAMQLSARAGFLRCALVGGKVKISGEARPFLIGDIMLPE